MNWANQFILIFLHAARKNTHKTVYHHAVWCNAVTLCTVLCQKLRKKPDTLCASTMFIIHWSCTKSRHDYEPFSYTTTFSTVSEVWGVLHWEANIFMDIVLRSKNWAGLKGTTKNNRPIVLLNHTYKGEGFQGGYTTQTKEVEKYPCNSL